MEQKQIKNWLRENWFKLGILVVLIIFVNGVAVYLNDKNKLAEQERLDRITKEAEIKVAEEQVKIEREQAQRLTQEKKYEQRRLANQVAVTQNARIVSQIVEFEDVLEGKIVQADINCSVLATSNNLLVVRPVDLSQDWFDNKEATKEKCRTAFTPLVFLESRLVAEPELQALRKILTDYIKAVKSLAVYALDGGYLASVIEKYSVEFDTFGLQAREELLRLQRQYNVKPQYITQ